MQPNTFAHVSWTVSTTRAIGLCATRFVSMLLGGLQTASWIVQPGNFHGRFELPLARSWMRLFIDRFQTGSTDVRIDLSGHQALVAQQLLDATDVGTTIQQMGRKTVP